MIICRGYQLRVDTIAGGIKDMDFIYWNQELSFSEDHLIGNCLHSCLINYLPGAKILLKHTAENTYQIAHPLLQAYSQKHRQRQYIKGEVAPLASVV